MEAGDTTGALPVLDAAIERPGYEDANYLGLPWHQYGRVLTRFDARRAHGIRILEQRIAVLSGGTRASQRRVTWLTAAEAVSRPPQRST